MKKKTLIISMVLMILVAFTACGKASPTDTVKNQIKQVKTEDASKELKRVFSDTKLQEQYKDDFSKLIEKIQDFDYEVKDEKIDGDTATVIVEIKTYDFGKAYKSTYDQVVADASSGKITASSDLKKYVYDLLFSNLNSVKGKNFKKTVNVTCTKNDKGEWETNIDSSNVEFQDAIMGGMITAIREAATNNL